MLQIVYIKVKFTLPMKETLSGSFSGILRPGYKSRKNYLDVRIFRACFSLYSSG